MNASKRLRLLMATCTLAVMLSSARAQHQLMLVDGTYGLVAAIGDIDADGADDWLMMDGARSVAFSGRTGVQIRIWPLRGSIAGPGDIDGDGRPDIAVGDELDSQVGGVAGAVYVINGKSGAVVAKLLGEQANDWFGRAVSGVGDVDLDGRSDFAVVASAQSQMPYMKLFSGRTLSVIRRVTLGSRAGLEVANVGDVDKDGWPDQAVGDATNRFLRGRVEVYSGRDGHLIYGLDGGAQNDQFGGSIAGLGDVNMDGYADFVVGAWGESTAGSGAGAAYLYSGKDATVLWTGRGRSPSAGFGTVANAGDVDGDGAADFCVGADSGYPQMSIGYVQLFSGRTRLMLQQFDGRQRFDHFGAYLAGIGDANLDGHPDLVIAAPGGSAIPYVKVLSTMALALESDIHQLSVATGGRQTLTLRVGTAHAGDAYQVLGSVSGVRPGIPYAGMNLPLNLDGYMLFTAASPNTGPLMNTLGTLNAAGEAMAAWSWGPLPPALVGLTLDHAYLVFSRTTWTITSFSNAVPLTLRP